MKTRVGTHRCGASRSWLKQFRRPNKEKRVKSYFSHKRWTVEKLLPLVRMDVQNIRDNSTHGWEWRVSADSLALKYSAKKALVTACLHRLTAEGLIGHKIRGHVDHDGCWFSSFYSVVRK